MTQAEQIYNKHAGTANQIVFHSQHKPTILAAIQEALDTSAAKLAAKEKELQELREGIPKAYDEGKRIALLHIKDHFPEKYKNGHDYYIKTFTNEK